MKLHNLDEDLRKSNKQNLKNASKQFFLIKEDFFVCNVFKSKTNHFGLNPFDV